MGQRQFFKRPALGHRMGQWLLAIDMLARLKRRLADRHMPVIGRADDHAIHIGLFGQKIAIVAVDSGFCERLEFLRGLDLLPIDIADRHDLLIELGQFRHEVAPHLSPHADAGECQRLVSRRLGASDQRQRGRSEGGRMHKLTAGEQVRHGDLHGGGVAE